MRVRSMISIAISMSIAALVFVGCSSKSSSNGPTGAPKNYSAAFRATLANPAPAEVQEGERVFFEDTYGIEVHDEWPPTSFMTNLWKSDAAKWGEQFSKYGWIVDPGDDLPVGFKRGSVDATKVHQTCAACHTARLDDGRIWAGMPAAHLDWAGFRLAVNAAWTAAGNPPLETAAGIAKLEAVQQPGGFNAAGDGDTNDVPANFSLYVDLGQRHNLDYLGASDDARSEVWLSVFTMGAEQDGVFPSADADALSAYTAWITAPKPLTFDADAAARGRTVFRAQRCDSCHHDDIGANRVAEWRDGPELVPGDDPAHTEGTIGTDPGFYRLSSPSTTPGSGPVGGLDNLLQFISRNFLRVRSTDGYAVPDLHGLFATAPYLHNGAVPTLQDLLTPPDKRPTTFVRDGHTVDTSKSGMSNAGHGFGATLSDADKGDLIAYLSSL